MQVNSLKSLKTPKKSKYTNIYVKRRLLKLEIDIFGTIANGLTERIPKKKILKQVKDSIRSYAVHVGLSDQEMNRLWINATKHYDRISKKSFAGLRKTDVDNLDQRREVIYLSIRAYVQNNSLIKEANEIMYSYEFRAKHDAIFGVGGLLELSRDAAGDASSRAYSPFFLASSHPKPAKDHAAWEGKMYYDEDWETLIPPDHPDYARIQSYIRNHHLLTVQYIVGGPVYLTTRRNCRHYLRNIPLEDVLHASTKKLLKTYKMYMPDDVPVSRDVQIYREYYSRLKIEEELFKALPITKLEQDIKRDKKLLAKWKGIINN